MARQQNQQSGEGKAPLIVALAFFILTSLALGVLVYMGQDQIAQERDKAKKADDGEKAAQKLRSAEQEKVLVYKAALDIATPEELDNLKNMRNKDEVRKEYTGLMTAVEAKLKGTDVAQGLVQKASKDFVGTNVKFDVTTNDVIRWNWPEGTALDKGPEKSIIEAVVSSFARAQLATAKAATEIAAAKKELATYQAAAADAEKQKQKFDATAQTFPAKVNEVTDSAKKEVKAVRDLFGAATKKYIDDARVADEKLGAKDIKIADLERIVAGLREQVASMENKLDTREDPFAFDRPHGKIIKRVGNVVHIDIGSAANVRAGLTFSVQPSDTPERGLVSRMKPQLDKYGRQVFDSAGDDKKPVMEIRTKGKIEVTEVLGPNLSMARITEQGDSIREALMAGDVLYNSAWRPGSADHVALFGVFDTDGDGNDDIKQLVRDLARMGVIVDAYYDLELKKWQGTITPQTIYAIEGYYPAPSIGVDALAAAKGAIDASLREAKQQAKEKGARVVKARDFFTRIGYQLKLDISGDTINRAYNKYLQVAPPAEGDMPPKN